MKRFLLNAFGDMDDGYRPLLEDSSDAERDADRRERQRRQQEVDEQMMKKKNKEEAKRQKEDSERREREREWKAEQDRYVVNDKASLALFLKILLILFSSVDRENEARRCKERDEMHQRIQRENFERQQREMLEWKREQDRIQHRLEFERMKAEMELEEERQRQARREENRGENRDLFGNYYWENK